MSMMTWVDLLLVRLVGRLGRGEVSGTGDERWRDGGEWLISHPAIRLCAKAASCLFSLTVYMARIMIPRSREVSAMAIKKNTSNAKKSKNVAGKRHPKLDAAPKGEKVAPAV